MRLIKSLKEINCLQDNFPIFFWDKWFNYELSKNCDVFLCCDEEKKAIIPFCIYNLRFLKKANYLYAPLDFEGNPLSPIIEKEFIEKVHLFLKKHKVCDVIFPPMHVCNFKEIPSKSLYFTLKIIKVNIFEQEQVIFERMNSNHKRQINKAIKESVLTKFDVGLFQDFYSLYKDTHLKQKIGFEPEKHFEKLLAHLSNNIQIGVSEKNNSCESAVFNVFDYKFAYYFYGGKKNSTILPGANKLLFWETIKRLKSIGISEFILGGYRNPALTDSKHEGIQDFKLKFGAKIQDGYHFIKIINPIKFHLFAFALKCKSILTGKDYSFINKSGLEIRKSK